MIANKFFLCNSMDRLEKPTNPKSPFPILTKIQKSKRTFNYIFKKTRLQCKKLLSTFYKSITFSWSYQKTHISKYKNYI